MWLAGTSSQGFLLGATSGRTTLKWRRPSTPGRPQSHSFEHDSTLPRMTRHSPYELAVIIGDGMRRMFVEGEEIFYISLSTTRNFPMPFNA